MHSSGEQVGRPKRGPQETNVLVGQRGSEVTYADLSQV